VEKDTKSPTKPKSRIKSDRRLEPVACEKKPNHNLKQIEHLYPTMLERNYFVVLAKQCYDSTYKVNDEASLLTGLIEIKV
jgi:uncharacterized membrane protein